jgi:hypothetical protein
MEFEFVLEQEDSDFVNKIAESLSLIDRDTE